MILVVAIKDERTGAWGAVRCELTAAAVAMLGDGPGVVQRAILERHVHGAAIAAAQEAMKSVKEHGR